MTARYADESQQYRDGHANVKVVQLFEVLIVGKNSENHTADGTRIKIDTI